jgi:hypothetical protein
MKSSLLCLFLFILQVSYASLPEAYDHVVNGPESIEIEPEEVIQLSHKIINKKNADELFFNCMDQECQEIALILSINRRNQKRFGTKRYYIFNRSLIYDIADVRERDILQMAELASRFRGIYYPYKMTNEVTGFNLDKLKAIGLDTLFIPYGLISGTYRAFNRGALRKKLHMTFHKGRKDNKLSNRNFMFLIFALSLHY